MLQNKDSKSCRKHDEQKAESQFTAITKDGVRRLEVTEFLPEPEVIVLEGQDGQGGVNSWRSGQR